MNEKLTKVATDNEGNVYVADADKSAFRVENKYTKTPMRTRDLSIYLHDALVCLQKFFDNEEINLAAYLVLSKYATKRQNMLSTPRSANAKKVEIWNLTAMINSAKAKKGFKYLGSRQSH